MLVLKRLPDALRDHDRVLAVIRGTAVNQDGYTRSITAPNGQAQVSLLRSAHRNARVEPEQIGYIEAHSTGTPLGDATELGALQEVFKPTRTPHRPLVVGSVKSNVGHLESAAGALSMIKTVLCLQKKMIPPVVHFRKLNPDIDSADFPLHIPTTLTPWDDKFNELKEYKSKYRHCNVPQKSGPLGAWVAKQRYEYLRKQKKEPSQMTDDRIKLLEGIGFNWTLTL